MSCQTRHRLPHAGLVALDVLPAAAGAVDRRAILSVYGSVLVARSDDFYFNQDSIAVRATFRFGAKVSDTDRVVLVPVLDELNRGAAEADDIDDAQFDEGPASGVNAAG